MKSVVVLGFLLFLAAPSQSIAQKTVESLQAEALDYVSRGRHQEAADALRQVTRLKPNDATAHNLLGVELSELGLFIEAAESLSRALQLDPASAVAHRQLCVVHYNLKQYSQAVESCQQAIRLKSDFSLAYHDLAMSLFEVGKTEEAVNAVKQRSNSNPISLRPMTLWAIFTTNQAT